MNVSDPVGPVGEMSSLIPVPKSGNGLPNNLFAHACTSYMEVLQIRGAPEHLQSTLE